MTPITDAFFRALGWVLAHSLWQGALVALVLLMLLPRLRSARQRYLAAYLTLMGLFLAAIGTFLWKFEPATVITTTFSAPATNITLSNTWWTGEVLASSLPEQFCAWMDANHTLIVALWLSGLVFFLIRLGGGLLGVHRLRTRGVRALDAQWQEKTQLIAQKMGIQGNIRLLESALVRSPLTLGWLKPLILLPIGFINQLSVAEVEAVLAHELAHIARRDWFFNLLQAFIETLFYYHPAVWWISQIIHRERENACDDAALAVTGNPIAFARALVQVQELATPAPALAMALSGKRYTLLDRVRRILNQAPQQQHQVMEKITATVILVALLALVGLRANTPLGIEQALAQITEFPSAFFGFDQEEMPSDTVPKPKVTQKITREDGNKRVEAEYQNGELTKLSIDGKEIPAAEFPEHEDLVDELTEDLPVPPAPPAPPGVPSFPGYYHFNRPDFPAAFSPTAPLAPLPPMPPMAGFPAMDGISVVTDEDENGNTVIIFNNNGESREMVIKNGEIWVGNQKLEKGAEWLLPGNFLTDDRNGFSYFMGENPEERSEFLESYTKERNKEIEMAMKEAHEAMKEQQKEMEREMKRASKEWKEQAKEWEKAQKEQEKAHRDMQKEHLKMQKEHQAMQREHEKMQAKSMAIQERIKAALLSDGLISDGNNFSFSISSKELKVNKKKQSDALRLKYQQIIQSIDPNACKGDNWNYNINMIE
ncbi:MAG TPA: M56 family metallopeptidase [Saprospiraceae bacterium]|nr:M56 family metallopeptidase [Saprospiraceae bacterium]